MRGDCGYGNEVLLSECEARPPFGLPAAGYLAPLDSPPKSSPRAGSWPTSSRSFTTGGTSTRGSTTANITAKPITSRPALQHGVARLVRSGGQRTVKVSVRHEKSDLITAAIAQVSNTLARFQSIAEQWTIEQRWTLLLTHIFRHWLGGKWLDQLPPEAEPLLSG